MVPASVKAGRRRVSAAEACLRSCGLTRWRRGATTRGTGWIRLPLSRVPASKFRLRVGWFYSRSHPNSDIVFYAYMLVFLYMKLSRSMSYE